MLREARAAKVHDWLVNYVVKKNPAAEKLRLEWLSDSDPVWQVPPGRSPRTELWKSPDGLDLSGAPDHN